MILTSSPQFYTEHSGELLTGIDLVPEFSQPLDMQLVIEGFLSRRVLSELLIPSKQSLPFDINFNYPVRRSGVLRLTHQLVTSSALEKVRKGQIVSVNLNAGVNVDDSRHPYATILTTVKVDDRIVFSGTFFHNYILTRVDDSQLSKEQMDYLKLAEATSVYLANPRMEENLTKLTNVLEDTPRLMVKHYDVYEYLINLTKEGTLTKSDKEYGTIREELFRKINSLLKYE